MRLNLYVILLYVVYFTSSAAQCSEMYTINIIVFLICAGCYYGMTENVEENNRTKKWRTEKNKRPNVRTGKCRTEFEGPYCVGWKMKDQRRRLHNVKSRPIVRNE